MMAPVLDAALAPSRFRERSRSTDDPISEEPELASMTVVDTHFAFRVLPSLLRKDVDYFIVCFDSMWR